MILELFVEERIIFGEVQDCRFESPSNGATGPLTSRAVPVREPNEPENGQEKGATPSERQSSSAAPKLELEVITLISVFIIM